jgi:CDP-diacylglycerol--glycerol-3-phosphate 3-phosphatidyltransferase
LLRVEKEVKYVIMGLCLENGEIDMNLPNKLTVFRMVLVPTILAVALLGEEGIVTWDILGSQLSLMHLICLVLFIIASLTDLFDGKLARKHNLVTTFGKFMDPIADKMLVNTMLVLLAYWRMIPVVCVVLMIMRDLIVDAIRLLAAEKQVVVAAGPLGKLKTVMQMAAIIIVLLDNFPLGFLGVSFDLITIWLATLISVISGLDYLNKHKEMIMESI